MAKRDRLKHLRSVKGMILKLLKLFSRCPCGENDVTLLTFHHINPAQKKNTICRFATNNSCLNTFIRELKKCTILCRSCHDNEHKKSKGDQITITKKYMDRAYRASYYCDSSEMVRCFNAKLMEVVYGVGVVSCSERIDAAGQVDQSDEL